MPFSSTDVAALTGGFSQQVMLQQQQAAMISNQFGGYAPSPLAHPVAPQGEQFAGMLMQGLGGMGMSAMGSQRLNSLGGGISAPFTQSGQMLMGQMLYGAQQQQMLDVNLRQAYRFPNAFGGRGFSGSDTGMIGSNLRQLSHMRGPSGETTSFEELGQLASNMGRMGMAEGVRSAKDFNEKFKQMLSSVKTIASELGTSLEEAQKVMASMKGSGIFNNQGQVASMIRKGAIAGNVSTAELSSSALMGAQISRSVGGKGRAGAFAGISTMSNIGAATQAGVLSEEDIYNVTGLSGAEGRQALAQNMMSGDASFFSGGLGRRVLASIAGKNGSVNESDVMAYMAGGVSTSETMRMAHKNLAKVGRANFIRNEGRLRGEAMAAFGGLGKAIAARNWMEERGHSMTEMDDRSMLFFQRKFNVGRDEADQLIKMARNMDTILGQRQKSAENDQYMSRLDKQDKQSSPEEIVKRLEMARNQVNDGLREVGAAFYKSMSTTVGEFLGSMSGEYVKGRRTAMADITNKLYRGSSDARSVLASELGVRVNNGKVEDIKHASLGSDAIRSELFGSGKLSTEQFSRFLGGNAQAFREEGYDITKAKSMDEVYAIQRKARKEGHNIEFSDPGLGSKFSTLDAENRAIGSLILGNRSRYGEKGAGKYTQTFGGIATDAALTMGGEGTVAGRTLGKVSSLITGVTSGIDASINKYTADTAAGAKNREELAANVAWAPGAIAGIFGDKARGSVEGWIKRQVKAVAGEKNDVEAQAVAEYMKGDEARSTAGRLMSGYEGERRNTRADLMKSITELRKKKERSAEETTRLHGSESLMAMSTVQELADRFGGLDKVPADRLEKAAKAIGLQSADEMISSARGSKATWDQERERDLGKMFEGLGQRAREEIDSSKEEGSSESEIQKDIESGEIKVSRTARDYLSSIQSSRKTLSDMTGATRGKEGEQNRGRYTSVLEQQEQRARQRAGMTVADRRKFAREMAQLGQGSESALAMAEVHAQERLSRGERAGAGGREAAIADMLGVTHEKGEFKGMGTAAAKKLMLERLGLSEGSTTSRELEALLGDKSMSAGTRAQRLTTLSQSKEVVTAAEEKDKKQKESDAQRDPSYRRLGEIKESLGTIDTTMKGVRTALGGTLSVKMESMFGG